MPMHSASTITCHATTTPASVTAASTNVGTAVAACATTSMRRFGNRSASAPANGPMRSPGPCCATVTNATAAAESVSRNISQDCATICTHMPKSDAPCPT
jgi:hypothetical protein